MTWTVVVLAVALLVWSAKLVMLLRSVEGYSSYWEQPRGTSGGLRYVALGDSAAQGVGASSPRRGYVALLAARLRQQTGRPVELINLSRSGARLSDVLAHQVPTLRALHADVVTVAVGGNDIRHYDAPAFAVQAKALADALPPGTFIADVPYFMHGRWQDDAAEAAAVVSTEARRAGLRLVRLQDAQRDRGARAMVTDFAADWFHPNDRGHRVWAEAFWAEMRGRVPDPW